MLSASNVLKTDNTEKKRRTSTNKNVGKQIQNARANFIESIVALCLVVLIHFQLSLCFRIRIDFNIRKFKVTSQDKQQCKQIDGPNRFDELDNALHLY